MMSVSMLKFIKLTTTFNNTLIKKSCPVLCNLSKLIVKPERSISNNYPRFLRIMKQRRKMAGPERLRKRSEWSEWNYKAELYAFSKRLHENISENSLKTAFTHPSYIESEEEKRTEMGMHDVSLDLTPNSELVAVGIETMATYVKGFIRYCYPHLPEEGVLCVNEYLLSDNVLSHVSKNIGTTDLILSADFPVTDPTLATTLKAIVGAICVDNDERQAHLFIHDFICTQLIGKDIFDIWDISNPLQLVSVLLKRHHRAPYESRLVFESGRNTIEAVYQVGLFSDKVFLGQGMGETVPIAEEMAAYDVLRRLFHLTGAEKPLPFGKNALNLYIDLETQNLKLSEWYSKKFTDKSLPLA